MREEIAMAIYHAAFDPNSRPGIPSPGWCWRRASQEQRDFALRQADAALDVITRGPQAGQVPGGCPAPKG